MSTPNVNITPAVAIWARERVDMSVKQLADALNVEADVLTAWEAGKAEPTFRQAQKLAHVLRIPFGYLFLSKAPAERMQLPDLRTVAGVRIEASAELIDVLSDALRKQQWYSEF